MAASQAGQGSGQIKIRSDQDQGSGQRSTSLVRRMSSSQAGQGQGQGQADQGSGQRTSLVKRMSRRLSRNGKPKLSEEEIRFISEQTGLQREKLLEKYKRFLKVLKYSSLPTSGLPPQKKINEFFLKSTEYIGRESPK